MATCVHVDPPLRPSLHASKSRKQLQSSAICGLPVSVNSVAKASLTPTANATVSHKYCVVLSQCPIRNQKPTVVCLFGGKDKSEKNKEQFPWSFERLMENFKGKSVEDALRKQIENQEFYDGSGGQNPPRGGSGGGSGGGDGTEDEGFAGILDETLQVVLATIGFIFLYVYIISGEELTRLAKDYIKYLFKGSKSARLKKAMYKWKRLYKTLTETEMVDKHWLEKAIVNTPTDYDSPSKYRRLFKLVESNADD